MGSRVSSVREMESREGYERVRIQVWGFWV